MQLANCAEYNEANPYKNKSVWEFYIFAFA